MNKIYGFGNAMIDIEIQIEEKDLLEINIEKGNIIQVMANGFTIGDRLLRAAQVGVSSGVIQNKEEDEKES